VRSTSWSGPGSQLAREVVEQRDGAIMPQYHPDILNTFGAPQLAALAKCGAPELSDLPDYTEQALWNHILGANHPDAAVLHLDSAMLRRTNAAAHEYRIGRDHLVRYIDGLGIPTHRLKSYLLAVSHFEQCVIGLYHACELFNRMEKKVLGDESKKLTLFVEGKNSDLERLNKLANVAKHFSAEQASKVSTPIWLSNFAIESADASLTFVELHENIVACSEVLRVTFVEIPGEAARRRGRTGNAE
jgi:hypothetical protein